MGPIYKECSFLTKTGIWQVAYFRSSNHLDPGLLGGDILTREDKSSNLIWSLILIHPVAIDIRKYWKVPTKNKENKTNEKNEK